MRVDLPHGTVNETLLRIPLGTSSGRVLTSEDGMQQRVEITSNTLKSQTDLKNYFQVQDKEIILPRGTCLTYFEKKNFHDLYGKSFLPCECKLAANFNSRTGVVAEITITRTSEDHRLACIEEEVQKKHYKPARKTTRELSILSPYKIIQSSQTVAEKITETSQNTKHSAANMFNDLFFGNPENLANLLSQIDDRKAVLALMSPETRATPEGLLIQENLERQIDELLRQHDEAKAQIVDDPSARARYLYNDQQNFMRSNMREDSGSQNHPEIKFPDSSREESQSGPKKPNMQSEGPFSV
jgi:hypothetical protein